MSTDGWAREQGITKFDVRDDGSTLEIEAFDGNGDAIAHLSLKVGSFVTTDDPRLVYGRQMEVEVHGRVVKHESEGLQPLFLPPVADGAGRDLNAFLRDSHVRPELALRGVNLRDVELMPSESAYAVGEGNSGICEPCSGFPTFSGCANSTYYSFGEWPEQEGGPIGQFLCCGNRNFAQRSCGLITSCGTPGPAGCAVCWLSTWETDCNIQTEYVAYPGCDMCTYSFY